MPTMTVISRRLIDRLKSLAPTFLSWVGLRLLTKKQTEELMQPYQISYSSKAPVSLVDVFDVADPQKVLFPHKVIETDPDFVWDYVNTTNKAALLRSGNVKIGNSFLDTDFGN
ncbi:MAG: hypothetical protein EOO39_22940, partial [Cytophagaceae bacterium]